MNLKELSSPIRAYWDIGPVRNVTAADCARIAGEIAANKVLSLEVTEASPSLSEACLAVLGALKDKTVALSLVAPQSALNSSTLALLRGLSVRELLVSAATLAELEGVNEIKKKTEGRPAVGVSFPVSRANFRELPGVLKFCVRHDIAHLVLPMQRLTGDEECFLLNKGERQELASRLKGIDRPSWLKIVIHDPFLWRVLYPSVRFPEGGCQAANTMFHISPNADVYPCPSLPVRIGNLLETSLKEVTRSDIKRELRKKLIASPHYCADCEELDHCLGGCRGRAYRLRNSLEEPDPACR